MIDSSMVLGLYALSIPFALWIAVKVVDWLMTRCIRESPETVLILGFCIAISFMFCILSG